MPRWIISRWWPSSGSRRPTALGADYQQEVDLISLFKDVADHYVHMASNPAQIRHLVDRAIRIALAERTVTCIILPNDMQEMDAVASPQRKHGTTFTGIGFTQAGCRSASGTTCGGRPRS